MKEKIHPNYVETKVTCGCGNSFTTRSTKPELKVDICSKCHPFYTGRVKNTESRGAVKRFKDKYTSYFKKQQEQQGE